MSRGAISPGGGCSTSIPSPSSSKRSPAASTAGRRPSERAIARKAAGAPPRSRAAATNASPSSRCLGRCRGSTSPSAEKWSRSGWLAMAASRRRTPKAAIAGSTVRRPAAWSLPLPASMIAAVSPRRSRIAVPSPTASISMKRSPRRLAGRSGNARRATRAMRDATSVQPRRAASHATAAAVAAIPHQGEGVEVSRRLAGSDSIAAAMAMAPRARRSRASPASVPTAGAARAIGIAMAASATAAAMRGVARIVAGTPSVAAIPKWHSTIGVETSHAATDAASRSARRPPTAAAGEAARGSGGPNQRRRRRGASRCRASTAAKESWKPGRSISPGATSSRPTAAIAVAAVESQRRPRILPMLSRPAMRPARSTGSAAGSMHR